jgi:hypothetical protein
LVGCESKEFGRQVEKKLQELKSAIYRGNHTNNSTMKDRI